MPPRPGSAACPFPFRGVDEQGRPYVQPTHGLGARAGRALSGGITYENLGGRMLLRQEHEEHLRRLQKAAPGIDTSMPRSFQERKRQQRLQQSRFGGGAVNSSSASLGAPAAIEGGGAGGRSAGSVGRLRSVVAAQNGGGNNTSLALTNNTGSNSVSRPRSKARGSTSPTRQQGFGGGGGAGASAAAHAALLVHERNVPQRDVFGALPEDAQMVCRSVVEVLEHLTTADSRTLLTQLLREAEEKRLLQAYSGVFPTMMNDASGFEQQQQQQQQQHVAVNENGNVAAGQRLGSSAGSASQDEL